MTDKKPIPSLASLRQNTSKTNSLAQLKAKMENKSPSLASLASSSKKPTTSLQSLATRSATPSLSSLAQKTTTNNIDNNSSNKKLTSLATKPMKPVIKPTTNNIPISSTSTPPHDIKAEAEEEEQEQDQLYGKPSAVAQFLFKQTTEPRDFNAESVFQQATQKPTFIQVFKFDQPSPDDIVLAAQSQRGGKHLSV